MDVTQTQQALLAMLMTVVAGAAGEPDISAANARAQRPRNSKSQLQQLSLPRRGGVGERRAQRPKVVARGARA